MLTRRNGEALRIGPEVRIRVLSISRGQVRLGVEAPADLLVLRDEVYERVVEANREAAEPGVEGTP
ncbi:MAG: carbon storage regulator [Myxococcota bacterium]